MAKELKKVSVDMYENRLTEDLEKYR